MTKYRYTYTGQFPSFIPVYTPHGVKLESFEQDEYSNQDLIEGMQASVNGWTPEIIKARQQSSMEESG